MRGKILLGFVGIVVIVGCKDEEKERQERAAIAASVRLEMENTAEAKARAEAEAKAERKKEFAENPGNYLEASDLQYFDKGIINDYRQLIGVTIENKSEFKVKNLKGKVDWMSDDGNLVGSSPITLKGDIAPGDPMTFTKDSGTLSSGTIQGAASKAKITFESVKVID